MFKYSYHADLRGAVNHAQVHTARILTSWVQINFQAWM